MTSIIKPVSAVFAFIAIGALVLPAWSQTANDGAPESSVRVGTFDSRAVAIACYRSKPFRAELKEKFSSLKKLKAEGNDKRVKELEAEGPALQELMHLQSFGTWPVDDVLSKINGEIPGIAKQAGVQMIVSQWDIAFQQEGLKFVDVTDLMVKPFEPDAETLKVIKEIREMAPISVKALKKHKH